MKILHTHIYKYSIPMVPFSIATGTMHYAQNLYISMHTDAGIEGVGECSAFPMISGETQATCFAMAQDFAAHWKGRDPLQIADRMQELHSLTAYAFTAKSAFDMALYDIASKAANQPLYQFLGGNLKPLETDLTIGIDTPDTMAAQAVDFIGRGVRILKVKLGKNGVEDISRIKKIRAAVGPNIQMRIDANQGWDYATAVQVLQSIEECSIEFCEQPMRYWDDDKLPALRRATCIKIMADESVFTHHDADRLIRDKACDYVNIKLAKSGGILEAQRIADRCDLDQIPCMMGGMLESRVALSAFAHFALANDNIVFYDMDTCLLGHKVDPVLNGVTYDHYHVKVPDLPGIGASADPTFLLHCEQITI